MRVFFDTEFIEDGRTIELVSIGLVREDGQELYLESSEFDPYRLESDPWLKENVAKQLTWKRTARSEIAKKIVEFVGPAPEFWAYYADYDWVVLCQLYGRMIDLPQGWPMYCRDLKQVVDLFNFKDRLPKQLHGEHNALSDAYWVKNAYEHIINNGIQL